MMPSVLALPHGAWPRFDEDEEIDKAGADNILTAPVSTGLGTSGWNTVICNVKKYEGDPLTEDKDWDQLVYLRKERCKT